MLAGLSFKVKLIGFCGFIAAMTGLLAAVTYVSVGGMRANYEHIVDDNLPAYRDLGNMRSAFRSVRLNATRLGFDGASADFYAAAVKSARAAIEKYDAASVSFRATSRAAAGKALFDEMDVIWQGNKAVVLQLLHLAESSEPSARQSMRKVLEGDFVQVAKKYDKVVDEFMAFQDEEARSWTQTAKAEGDWGMKLSVGLSLVVILVTLVLGLLFSRSLPRQLGSVVTTLASGAGEMTVVARAISTNSGSLALSSEEQAGALQETVTAIEEISAMVAKNAQNAALCRQVSTQSREAANGGQEAVQQMLDVVGEISRSNAEIDAQNAASSREIAEIVKVIAEIDSKTKVINDIVFQTRLLSFNASVEAARAGEHGKGFSVVAEEVGKLAQMSGDAARDISQMLEASMQKVAHTVEANKSKVQHLIGIGKTKIESGGVTARLCGEALGRIVHHVAELDRMVGEITTASQEQALGIREVSKALVNLDQVTQNNATAAKEATETVEGLNAQAGLLRGVVSDLTRIVNGEGSSVPGVSLQPSAESRAA